MDVSESHRGKNWRGGKEVTKRDETNQQGWGVDGASIGRCPMLQTEEKGRKERNEMVTSNYREQADSDS
jgi:hypothetical protein